MKISYQWLKSYISLTGSPEEIAQQLTQAGLEVESVTPWRPFPKGLLVGEVLSCTPHPQADRLQKARVCVGQEAPLEIVCGAPNLAEGQKVVVALVGTHLTCPQGKTLQIKATRIRGETSEGMVCAASEIGLQGEEDEGILVLRQEAQAGLPIGRYFGGEEQDTILTIAPTPNRGDALSHFGVARELSAITGLPLKEPLIEPILPSGERELVISLREPSTCHRYVAVLVEGIKVAPSPPWLQIRLRAIGVTPSNNIVDITNFLMHGLGQPLHAFDIGTLDPCRIIIKKGEKGSVFTTLSGEEKILTGEELMVCDLKGPLCMAGIIGGQRSKVTPRTRHIMIEGACYSPKLIAKAARHHGLAGTDAAFRFARTTDERLPYMVVQRAVSMIEKIAKGRMISPIHDRYPHPKPPHAIHVTYAYLHQCLGIKLPPSFLHRTLERLGIRIEEKAAHGDSPAGFTAWVPTYRSEVRRPADLAEEILRIYGYDKVEQSPQKQAMSRPSRLTRAKTKWKISHQIGDFLAARGFFEIKGNALHQADYAQELPELCLEEQIRIANPSSALFGALRQSLLFSGLEAIAHNLHHGERDLRLFELGKTYARQAEKYKETDALSVFLTGHNGPLHWQESRRRYTLQDMVKSVKALLLHLRIKGYHLMPAEDLSHAQALALLVGQEACGYLGRISPSLLARLKIKQPVFFATLKLPALMADLRTPQTYSPLARFPAVVRDLSLVVPQGVTFTAIERLLLEAGIQFLQHIAMVDRYPASDLGADSQGYTLRLTFQHAKSTLKKGYVERLVSNLTERLDHQLGVKVRL